MCDLPYRIEVDERGVATNLPESLDEINVTAPYNCRGIYGTFFIFKEILWHYSNNTYDCSHLCKTCVSKVSLPEKPIALIRDEDRAIVFCKDNIYSAVSSVTRNALIKPIMRRVIGDYYLSGQILVIVESASNMLCVIDVSSPVAKQKLFKFFQTSESGKSLHIRDEGFPVYSVQIRAPADILQRIDGVFCVYSFKLCIYINDGTCLDLHLDKPAERSEYIIDRSVRRHYATKYDMMLCGNSFAKIGSLSIEAT